MYCLRRPRHWPPVPLGVPIAVSMSRSAADLPEDPAELRRFAAALATEVHAKTLLIEKLRLQLSILRRARFGRSSEKLDREIEQLELLLGDIEESDAERQARTEASEAKLLPPCRRKSRPSVRLCPIICRSKRSCTKRLASARPAAQRSLAGSAPMSAWSWNMCPHTSSACCMCARR